MLTIKLNGVNYLINKINNVNYETKIVCFYFPYSECSLVSFYDSIFLKFDTSQQNMQLVHKCNYIYI